MTLQMDFDSVKRYLEKGDLDGPDPNASAIQAMPSRFFERFIAYGLRVDIAEPGRIVCSMKVPQRLLNAANSLHGGATAALADLVGSAVMYTLGVSTSGVSVEINVSYLDAAYLDEEIEIEAKVLRLGKAIGVSSIELRKKTGGKIIAHGRHTKYLEVSSRM